MSDLREKIMGAIADHLAQVAETSAFYYPLSDEVQFDGWIRPSAFADAILALQPDSEQLTRERDEARTALEIQRTAMTVLARERNTAEARCAALTEALRWGRAFRCGGRRQPACSRHDASRRPRPPAGGTG